MEKGYTEVFCGDGDGKSSAAFGKALLCAAHGGNVIVVRFMKNKSQEEEEFFSRLEPELKFFRFERAETSFQEMSDEQKQEEVANIRNGLNYAKKVLATGECDMLVLDEILGLMSADIISVDEVRSVLSAKSEEAVVLLTGILLPDEFAEDVDIVSRITDESK